MKIEKSDKKTLIYKNKNKMMKIIIFNEESEMIEIKSNHYHIDKLVKDSSYNGTYDIQLSAIIKVINYDDVIDFIKTSLQEINLAIYDDDNTYFNQPYIEFEEDENKIVFYVIKTNFF